MKRILVYIVLIQLVFSISIFAQKNYSQHQPIILDFKSIETNETAAINPFTDYRLNVEFLHEKGSFLVPGFFAADGSAAETSANSGSVWRVIFTPPFAGQWHYTVSFKTGDAIAVKDDPYIGNPVKGVDGQHGSFNVISASPDAIGFEATGGIIYNNSHYFYTCDGNPKILVGPNSPENFLAFKDFDATYSADKNKNFIKSWEPHLKDWKKSDPVWQGEKGKGIIGALNYLASKKMNVVYAMTLTLEGDACDVWPFISPHKKDFCRYDVSKLAQWDIVFSHAEKLGIVFELVLQEQENQLILDDGYTFVERKLYLRELIARFGYHKNIIWNIGEENGEHDHYWPQGMNDQQRYMMIRYLKDHDPYKHPILMHTFAVHDEVEPIAKRLLRFSKFDGLSMQNYNAKNVHKDILYWINESDKFTRPWTIMMDELGPWHTGAKSDVEDPNHDEIRKDVLWGALMAGATGVQWYFGWNTPPNDLNAEDWRSRENLWEQSAIALNLFDQIDYANMKNCDSLITTTDGYCFGNESEYVIYLKNGGTTKLDLKKVSGSYDVFWYNPRKGGDLEIGTKKTINAGVLVEVGSAPREQSLDWVVLIRKTL